MEKPIVPAADFDISGMTDAQVEPFDTPWRRGEFKGLADGDTFRINVDVGLESIAAKKFRLIGLKCGIQDGRLGVDTWECKGETTSWGREALKRSGEIIRSSILGVENIRVLTKKSSEPDGAYGRWLACVAVKLAAGTEIYEGVGDAGLVVGRRPTNSTALGGYWYSLGDILLAEGHARVWWQKIAKQLRPITEGAPRPKVRKK